jgi:hypothetical protein
MKQLQFYKPNKSSTGHAASFSVSNGSLFCSMIKQFSWDEKNRSGTFSENKDNPTKKLSTKLSAFEAGSIINVIKNCTKFSTFHTSKDQSLSINFAPWQNQEGALMGFGFMIDKKSKTDSSVAGKFSLSLTLGESEVLALYLTEYIKSTFEDDGSQPQEKKPYVKQPYNKPASQAQSSTPAKAAYGNSRYGGYGNQSQFSQNKVENTTPSSNINEESMVTEVDLNNDPQNIDDEAW